MNFFKRIGAGLVLAVGLQGGSVARADSFGVTNQLANAVSLVSWPTNTVGTNGVPQLTGGKLDISQAGGAEGLGLFFSGIGLAYTNPIITVQMVRAWVDGSPQVVIGTNNQILRNDWEATPGISFSFIPAASTNGWTWGTNIPIAQLGNANWLGFYSITNGATLSVVSNFYAGGNIKLIPTRLK